MEYALDPGRRPQKAVRKVAAERLDLAIASLGTLADDAERSVHETRKRLKELRALLRLVRHQLPVRYGIENTRLGAAARVLSAGRDAHVLVRAFDRLVDHGGPLPEEVRAALADRADRATEALLSDPAVDDDAWVALHRCRAEVPDWRIDAHGFAAFADGLHTTYAAGRRQLTVVLADPDTEELHTLRTATKRLWYQTRLLRAAAPELLASTIDELDELGELLGDDHDLAVLADTLRAGIPGADPVAALEVVAVADGRRLELQAEALPRCRRFYAERPRAVVDRFGAWWELAG